MLLYAQPSLGMYSPPLGPGVWGATPWLPTVLESQSGPENPVPLASGLGRRWAHDPRQTNEPPS